MNSEYSEYGYDDIPDCGVGYCNFELKLKENFNHFIALQKILESTYQEWRGCGSYLMNGSTLKYDLMSHPKQRNLFEVSKGSNKVFEIGVHGAHSAFIMAIANPKIKIKCVDICEYSHVEKCVEYLKACDLAVDIELVKGSSPEILQSLDLGMFDGLDMVHIDGNHCANAIKAELQYVKDNAKNDMYVVFDDYDSSNIPNLVHSDSQLKVIDIPNCPHRNCVTRFYV